RIWLTSEPRFGIYSTPMIRRIVPEHLSRRSCRPRRHGTRATSARRPSSRSLRCAGGPPTTRALGPGSDLRPHAAREGLRRLGGVHLPQAKESAAAQRLGRVGAHFGGVRRTRALGELATDPLFNRPKRRMYLSCAFVVLW